MYARLSEYPIQPGKLENFKRAVRSMFPALRQQAGFRALLVLRTAEGAAPEALIISVWDSLDDLKASEKNMFLYQAVSRLLQFCKGFPRFHEHEVLLTEFAAD